VTDVIEMLTDANPVNEADLRPSFEAVWRTLDHSAPRRRRPMWACRPLMLGGATGTLGAATLAIVLLSAGGAPTAAQAFPILRTTTVELRTHAVGAPGEIVAWALRSAHPFSEPYGTGYVVERPQGNTMCLFVPSPSSTPAGPSTALFACGSTQSLEQQGTAFVVNGPAGSPDAFVALVPTGGALTVTADGATTAVSAHDGIATGLISQSEALTLHVGDSTTTEHVTPNSPASTQLTPTSPRAAALSYGPTLPTT
jgi:hypothetical protein